MKYKVSILTSAWRKLKNLSRQNYQKVRSAINKLAIIPKPNECKKIKNRPAYTLYTEVNRIVYEINDDKQEILIIDIGYKATFNRKIIEVIGIRNCTLAIFQTAAGYYKYSITNKDGLVYETDDVFDRGEAAARIGREAIEDIF